MSVLPTWTTRAHLDILRAAKARGHKWGWISGDGYSGGGSATRAAAEAAARRSGAAHAQASGGPAPWHSVVALDDSIPAQGGGFVSVEDGVLRYTPPK